jgi:hypothetical protein
LERNLSRRGTRGWMAQVKEKMCIGVEDSENAGYIQENVVRLVRK